MGPPSRAETEAFKGPYPTFKFRLKPSALAMTSAGVVKRWEILGPIWVPGNLENPTQANAYSASRTSSIFRVPCLGARLAVFL